MERFIFWDRETSTKLTLLRTLYLEEYWLSTEKLVKLSTLDKRTVLKYMKLLQADSDALPDNYDSIILSRKGLGHRFIGGKPAYVDFVHQLVSSSIPFSFISELYLHSQVDLEDFSEEYFISMTSLKELIGKFRTFFEPLEIFLVQEKGIISVTGNEISFRFFGYTFFWRITKGVYWPFETVIPEEKVDFFISQHFSPYIHMKTTTFSQWKFIVAINLCRIKKGAILSDGDLPEFAHQLNDTMLYELTNFFDTKSFTNVFFDLASVHVDAEFDFLQLFFQTSVQTYLIPGYLDYYISFHEKKQTPIFMMYQDILNCFDKEMKETDEETTVIARGLIFSTLMIASLFPSYETTISGYDYDEYLYQTYPYLRKEMESRLILLKQFYPSKLLDNNVLIVSRFCELYCLFGHPTDYNPEIKIKMETDLPVVMEKVLAHQVFSVLSPYFNVSILSTIHIPKDIIPDLIIASAQIVKTSNTDIFIAHINPALGSKDIKLIIKKVALLNSIKSEINLD